MLKPAALIAALVLPSAIALADTGTEAAQPAVASFPFAAYPQYNPQQAFEAQQQAAQAQQKLMQEQAEKMRVQQQAMYDAQQEYQKTVMEAQRKLNEAQMAALDKMYGTQR